jgi:hypothetical protein
MKHETATMSKQNRHKSSKSRGIEEEGQNAFEPMRIQLTVYSMEGIRRQDGEQSQKSLKIKKNTTPQSSFIAPTTALVSVRGQLIRTLVPSAPVAFHKQRKGEKSLRGMAFWQNDKSGDDNQRSKYDLPPTTFELLRDMKKQPFQPNTKIEQMSHYIPERIDLVVGIARGKEILPLGTSTVAVSGEEEGEFLTNIPIKALPMKTERKNGKIYPTKAAILNGDKHWYSLDSNAILRVGVRVIPRHNYIPTTMNPLITPKSPRWSNVEKIIELNDENSLIAKFKSEHQTYEKNTDKNQQDERPHGFSSFYFCGALNCWSEPSTSDSHQYLDYNKITEAQVLTVRGMSDVSGSTMRWNRIAGQYDA